MSEWLQQFDFLKLNLKNNIGSRIHREVPTEDASGECLDLLRWF